MERNIHETVKLAQGGDKAALSEVVSHIQDTIFRLSIRMLADFAAAEDATQEILVLVITKLSQFREDSRFSTWVYRIAVNYLLTAKKIRAREFGLTFDEFGEDLENSLQDHKATDPTDPIMYNELRVACTMAMLLCLDINHRIAYVLGRVFELDQSEAIKILDLPAATYRKRLSRASAKVEAFTAQKCGVVAPKTAACSCPRRLPSALEMGRVGPEAKLIRNGTSGPSYDDVIQEVARVEDGLQGLCAQRLVPDFKNPRNFTEKLEQILTIQAGNPAAPDDIPTPP
ncbi:RNA polymerase sigma factor [Tritonibacter horizontis]|uniref:ECF RNA polymerase sigma factor SigW n=1 Tax=Tritonibacter horizontis TaxID=1768241 RepID=A0A132C0Y6_9RHOB|nr:sigma-70 family RNA polymerase sigma factor [Tritonibacter horizontis]KUP94196.1 ECF RNA polymerase sigma factor SigW [Tritonibacter horizontis]